MEQCTKDIPNLILIKRQEIEDGEAGLTMVRAGGNLLPRFFDDE